jgi:hypothetical protein
LLRIATMHARGLRRDECTTHGAAAAAACNRFAQRNRAIWDRRNKQLPADETLKLAAFLSAIDPDCGSVEVVTRVWFPFSSNGSKGRYLTIGREIHPRADVREAPFSRLLSLGEELIDTGGFDGTFKVALATESLPPAADERGPPRLLAGFHSLVEVAARWSEDAVTHYPDDEGRRRWTRQVFAGAEQGRPIGGSVALAPHHIAAGGAPLITEAVFVDAAYAAISDLENERNLVLPQSPKPAAAACEVSDAPPAHAAPVLWRKRFFDFYCAQQPAGEACLDNRRAYRAFVQQQLGASLDLSGVDNPDLLPIAISWRCGWSRSWWAAARARSSCRFSPSPVRRHTGRCFHSRSRLPLRTTSRRSG